jgi:hypothetical protein
MTVNEPLMLSLASDDSSFDRAVKIASLLVPVRQSELPTILVGVDGCVTAGDEDGSIPSFHLPPQTEWIRLHTP